MAIKYIGNTISGTYDDREVTNGGLDLSDNEVGVLFLETDTGKLYQWDGDSWEEVTASDASTSVKGLASFSSDNFAVSSGAVTIKDAGVILGTETTGNYVATVAGTANEIDVSASTGAVTIGIPTNPTLTGNAIVTGNLTVQGDTITLGNATEVNATQISIDDPMIKMATNNTATNAVDIGFYGTYAISGPSTRYAGLIRDATDNSWYLFNTSGSNDEPTTTLNVSGIGLADLRVGNLYGTIATTTQNSITTMTGLVTTGTITTGVWNAGAVTSSGAVTGASLVADNTTINSDTISTSSGNLTIDPAADIIFSPSGISQNYGMSDRGTGLTLQSLSSGSNFRWEFFTADGDSTDSVALYLYAKGTPSQMTNLERGVWYYDVSNTQFFFGTDASGSGTARDLRIGVPAGKNIILGDDAAILTVAGSGRVGIGQASPTSTLHVVGDAQIDNINIDGSEIELPADGEIKSSSGDIYMSGADGVYLRSGTSNRITWSTAGGAIQINPGNATLDMQVTEMDFPASILFDVVGTTTFNSVVDITDATDSSDTSGDTGALRTEGGASIAKKLYVGSDLNSGKIKIGTQDGDNAISYALQVGDGMFVDTFYDKGSGGNNRTRLLLSENDNGYASGTYGVTFAFNGGGEDNSAWMGILSNSWGIVSHSNSTTGNKVIVGERGKNNLGFGGGDAINQVQIRQGGSYTSGGGSDYAIAYYMDTALTTHSGDNNYAYGMYLNPTITLSGVMTGTPGLVATLALDEPAITTNSNAVDHAASLYIAAAPSEATNSWDNTAIWVDGGNTRLDGTLWVTDNSNNDLVQINHDGTVGKVSTSYLDSGAFTPLTFLTSNKERIRLNTATATKIILTSDDAGATGPILNFFHDSASAATNDALGVIEFADTGSAVRASIEGQLNGNTSQGAIIFKTDGGSLTEKMRINRDGNIGIGTAAPTVKLTVGANDTVAFRMVDTGDSDATLLEIGHGNTYGSYIGMKDDAGTETVTLRSYANPSGYGSVFNAGNIGIGNITPGYKLTVDPVGNTWGVVISSWNTGGNTNILKVAYAGNAPDNTDQEFLNFQDTGDVRLKVNAQGDVLNHDNSYGSSSDIKLKQDVVDVRSYLEDWKKLRYRKFRWKTDVAADSNAPSKFGVIAQEAETVFPSLIDETVIARDENDAPTDTAKTFKYSVLNTIMGKVVQELIAKVEALEEEVRLLKG